MPMNTGSMFLHIIFLIVVCIILSSAAAAIYSYIVFSKFSSVDEAISSYRSSCTQAFSHRALRVLIFAADVIFTFGVIIKRDSFDDPSRKRLIYAAVIFTVITFNIYVFSSVKDNMARAKILQYIRCKYQINERSLSDWFVDLDCDDYPEELEFDIYDESGEKRERCFIVDLEHCLIREEILSDNPT